MNNTLIPAQVLNNNNDNKRYNPVFDNTENNLNNIQSNNFNTENENENENHNNNFFNHVINKPNRLTQNIHGVNVPQTDWNLNLISSRNIIDQAEDVIKNLSKTEPSQFINNDNSVPKIEKNKEESYKQPYTNWNDYEKPKLYYNNLNDDGKTQIVTQDILTFDSTDRDINKYENPFAYRVKFNPSSTNTDANILKKYKNVKYLSLDYVIIPKKFYIDKKIIDYSSNIDDVNNLITNFNDLNTNDVINNFTLS